jgi:E3 ubiquitin-protein ligase TRIP12
VAGLLASGDPAVVAAALQLAQLLMAKLPDVFRVHFVKEGVVHEMDKLAASAPAQASIESSGTHPAARVTPP